MSIKLMAFDLDNTLFDETGAVPQSTIRLLRKCMEQGVFVTIATGRMFPSARLVAQQIGTNAPIICYNGACIRSADGRETVSYVTLEQDIMQDLAVFCKERGLFLQLYHNDEILVEQDNDFARKDPDCQNAPLRSMGDLTKIILPKTPKAMIRATDDVIKGLEPQLNARYGGRVYIAQSTSDLLEIMDASVNKGRALERLAGHYSLERAEVAAFGDNSNDIEMVQWAGLGVAVANAVPRLKAISTYICQEQRSLGVEEAIKKHVLR